jgi:hypothetical protein
MTPIIFSLGLALLGSTSALPSGQAQVQLQERNPEANRIEQRGMKTKQNETFTYTMDKTDQQLARVVPPISALPAQQVAVNKPVDSSTYALQPRSNEQVKDHSLAFTSERIETEQWTAYRPTERTLA